MTATPSGSPAWARTNDHTSYGGHLDKANYLAQGAVDARTDVTAQNIARMAEDLAAMALLAPFAKVRVTCNDTAPAIPTINTYRSLAVSSLPVGARVSDGVFTLTWADSYVDAYGVSADIDIKFAHATSSSDSSGQFATYALSDTTANGKMNRITVYLWVTATGAAAADGAAVVEVD